MKSNIVFKRTFNKMLGLAEELGEGARLPSEVALSQMLGVSRTTVRKVLEAFVNCGVVTSGDPVRRVTGKQAEGFPDAETVSTSDHVEQLFMDWMLRDDARPGTSFSELELARQFKVAVTTIREFLNRFERFGLIEKRSSSGWVFVGFTDTFALELFEIREMFELRSALKFCDEPPEATVWGALEDLRHDHLALLDDIDTRFHDFSEIDSRFHRLITSLAPNRFIDSFYDIITLIFHYHYQWNKRDERERNEIALHEHLAYIDALASGSPARVEHACRLHLASARASLLRAIGS